MWEKKKFTVFLLFCVLSTALISIVHPLLMKILIDNGVMQRRGTVLYVAITGIILFAVIDFFITESEHVLQFLLKSHVNLGLLSSLMGKLNRVAPPRLFHKHKLSEMTSGLKRWTSPVSSMVSSVIPDLIQQMCRMSFAFVAMLWISPLMTGCCLIGVLFIFLVKRKLKKYTKLNQEMFELEDKIDAQTNDYIHAFRDIQVNGAGEQEKENFEISARASMQKNLEVSRVRILGIELYKSLTDVAVTAVILAVGVVFYHTLTIGQALQFMSYVGTFQVSVNWFVGQYLTVLEMTAELDRCDDVLSLEQIPVHPEPVNLDEIEELEYRNVTVTYPGSDEPVLRNVSLKIRQGETIGLVGPSGCGKTTLTSLLGRTLEPDSGQVLINGRSIKDYPLESVRKKVAFCFQDPNFLGEPIAENLRRLGKPNATDQELREAAFHASLELSDEMYEKRVDTLSGGQKQRLGIARVLLRRAEVNVFDEITSALDANTEEELLRRMRKRLEGTTSIFIAHRLSTIRGADRIVVMDKGEIVESGSHQELMSLHGLYHELWTKQQGQLCCRCGEKIDK
ncbi:ABC transporter ATP-binding protein/permease [Shimazuella sp. AN120528]|uniref:ABC transporter ATP-binding protein n=1 Tax=Shimazuella soli TaxID=1892854 RepID=UPI001F0DBEB8|nr:ABC transporter ATP-binding protein [Shimazuella soli]MCH5585603.1 ABC transporter ATP-binding protein/permease [Shimazuella soli]